MAKLSEKDRNFLALYSDSIYEKPSVTVDSVILRLKNIETNNYRKLPEKKLQVFLTKRAYSPYEGKYAIIGTFIDLKNELAETMQLCVRNKTNISKFYYEQLYTFGKPQRDPRTRVLSVSYLLLTNENEHLSNGEWFDINISESNSVVTISLENENNRFRNKLHIENDKITILESDLAFDHIEIIYRAVIRLRNKLEYTDIIFNLLPTEFTLTELKLSYEEILQTKLLDANFRRKTSHLVEPLNKFTEGIGHRPSQLFIRKQ